VTSGPPGLLVNDGREVFPLWEPRVERLVEELCHRHGLEIEAVSEAAPAPGGGLVVWSRPELRRWAELYARLTGREAIEEDEAEEPAAVVVLAPVELTPEWLAAREPTRPQGLLVVEPDRDPLEVVLGAKIARCRRPCAGAVLLDPGRDRALSWAGGAAAFEETSAGVALPALRDERGVLVLTTHSDGIDALIAPGRLTLCPRRGWEGEPDGSVPPCVGLHRCHRHDLPLDAPELEERTLAPGELQAFVLILAACSALVVQPQVRDRADGYGWSLMAGLLRARPVGVTVFGVGLHFDAADGHLALVGELAAGMPVGTCVAEENRRNRMGRLVLVGDPDACFRAAPAPAPPTRRRAPSTAGASATGARFLAAYLAEAAEGAPDDAPAATAATAHSLALALAMELDRRRANRRVVEHLHRRIVGAVTDFIGLRGTMIALDWSRLRASSSEDGEEACGWCGSPCIRRRYEFANPGLGRRYLVACPCCGIVRDSWQRRPRRVERVADAWRAQRRQAGSRPGAAAVARRAWGAERRTLLEPGRSSARHYLLSAAPAAAAEGELIEERAAGIYVEGGCLEIACLPADDLEAPARPASA
jgi:hypothetical protein